MYVSANAGPFVVHIADRAQAEAYAARFMADDDAMQLSEGVTATGHPVLRVYDADCEQIVLHIVIGGESARRGD